MKLITVKSKFRLLLLRLKCVLIKASFECGDNVLIDSGFKLKITRGSKIRFEGDNFVARNCMFSVSNNGKLIIKKGAKFGEGVKIKCRKLILIGEEVGVTDNCYLIDYNHDYKQGMKLNKPLASMKCLTNLIVLGKGSWVCANSIILPGSILGEYSVLGANSLLNTVSEPYSVLIGSPAKARHAGFELK